MPTRDAMLGVTLHSSSKRLYPCKDVVSEKDTDDAVEVDNQLQAAGTRTRRLLRLLLVNTIL